MKSPSVHLFFPVASSEALGDVCILKQSKTKQTKKPLRLAPQREIGT